MTPAETDRSRLSLEQEDEDQRVHADDDGRLHEPQPPKGRARASARRAVAGDLVCHRERDPERRELRES